MKRRHTISNHSHLKNMKRRPGRLNANRRRQSQETKRIDNGRIHPLRRSTNRRNHSTTKRRNRRTRRLINRSHNKFHTYLTRSQIRLLSPLNQIHFIRQRQRSNEGPKITLLTNINQTPRISQRIRTRYIQSHSISFIMTARPTNGANGRDIIRYTTTNLAHLLRIIRQSISRIRMRKR